MQYHFNKEDQTIILTNEPCLHPVVTEEQALHFLDQRDKGLIADLVKGEFVFTERQVIHIEPPYQPELTEEMVARQLRDVQIRKASDIIDRHRNQKEFGITTTLSDAEVYQVAHYIEYLRDLPSNPNWYKEPIKTMEEFNAKLQP